MDKKPFVNPEIDVTMFTLADIIATSSVIPTVPTAPTTGDDWSGGDF